MRWLGAIALLALAVVGLVYFVDLNRVGAILAAGDPVLLTAAVLAFLVGMAVYALRWWMLLPAASFWPVFHAANLGHAGNILIPGRAGEPGRVLALARSGEATGAQATSSVLVEKFVEQPTRVLFCGLALMAGLELPPPLVRGLLLGLVLLSLVFLSLLLFQNAALERIPRWFGQGEEKVRAILRDMYATAAFLAAPGRALAVVGLTLVTWGFFTASFWLTAWALELPGSALSFSLLAMGVSSPTAPTQPGLFHASLIPLMVAVGYPKEPVSAVVIVLHLYQMGPMIGAGLLGWLYLPSTPTASGENSRPR